MDIDLLNPQVRRQNAKYLYCQNDIWGNDLALLWLASGQSGDFLLVKSWRCTAMSQPVKLCHNVIYYRPQRGWGKVLFSVACVKNSVHGRRGVPGQVPRGQVHRPGRYTPMVNERAVRILLECILVSVVLTSLRKQKGNNINSFLSFTLLAIIGNQVWMLCECESFNGPLYIYWF